MEVICCPWRCSIFLIARLARVATGAKASIIQALPSSWASVGQSPGASSIPSHLPRLLTACSGRLQALDFLSGVNDDDSRGFWSMPTRSRAGPNDTVGRTGTLCVGSASVLVPVCSSQLAICVLWPRAARLGLSWPNVCASLDASLHVSAAPSRACGSASIAAFAFSPLYTFASLRWRTLSFGRPQPSCLSR